MKKIESYLHYYIGQKLERGGVITHALLKAADEASFDACADLKPILRRLSSMTEDEAVELVLVLFNTTQLEENIDSEEIQLDLAPNDGWLLVAEEMAIVIDVSCRCFEGQIGILHCGSIMLYDDDGSIQTLQNVPDAFHYLISRGFDLFGLLDAGLAIEKQNPKE